MPRGPLMLKAAFSLAGDRMAPVFDVARPFRVLEADGSRVVRESDAEFADDVPERRALHLVALGVTELVCGAISRQMHAALAARGMRVTPFVTGGAREVMRAWRDGTVARPMFAMPGCRNRGARRRGMANGGRWEDRPMGGPGRGGEMPLGGFGRGGRGGGGGGGGRGRGQGGGQGGGQGRGGRGLGRMGGPFAAGALGTCVCPACGHREPHQRGVPCVQTPCPKCGTAMARGVSDD